MLRFAFPQIRSKLEKSSVFIMPEERRKRVLAALDELLAEDLPRPKHPANPKRKPSE